MMTENRKNETASPQEIKSRSRFDKIALMRLLDIKIGSIICSVLALFSRKRALPYEVKKIALVKFFGFGNILMISPVFRQLKETYPGAELIFLTLKNNTKLVNHFKAVDRVIDIDISNFVLVPFRIIAALIELRKQNIDIVIDFEQFSRTSAIISFLGGRKFSVGFGIDGNPRELLYDMAIPCSDKEHAVLQFQKLLYYVQVPMLNKESVALEPIVYGDADRASIDPRLPNSPFIIFHVGNGPNAPEKRWDIENYVSLAKRLVTHGYQIALIGSKQDAPEVARFKELSTSPSLDFCNISLSELAYLMTKSHAYVSADTGPAHLAAAMGASSVILYGPTDPRTYGAWGKNVHFVYKGIWCSPCASNVTSKEIVCINKTYAKCMKDISVDEVERKVLSIVLDK